MLLIIWLLIFIVSLSVLIKASDYFTFSSEKIGSYFGIPHFIIGVTIVAIGTSLPELISSIFSVLNKSSEIVIGNVVGSNVTNIFLIIGVTAIIGKRIKIKFSHFNIDLLFLISSAFLLSITIWDGNFNLHEALLFLSVGILYVIYTIKSYKESNVNKKKTIKGKFEWKIVILLIVSTFFIYLGAKYTVHSIIKLSEILNLGKEIISVSALALGTSLPELMVTISASRKGNIDIAIGNVVGSNIFNTLIVMGIPTLFGSLIIPQSILNFSIWMMLIATLLFFFVIKDKELSKWEGWLFISFYIFFIGKLFNIF